MVSPTSSSKLTLIVKTTPQWQTIINYRYLCGIVQCVCKGRWNCFSGGYRDIHWALPYGRKFLAALSAMEKFSSNLHVFHAHMGSRGVQCEDLNLCTIAPGPLNKSLKKKRERASSLSQVPYCAPNQMLPGKLSDSFNLYREVGVWNQVEGWDSQELEENRGLGPLSQLYILLQ